MGAASSACAAVVPVWGAVVVELLNTPVSGTSSSSMSKGRTVVGDSGAAAAVGDVGLSLVLLWKNACRVNHCVSNIAAKRVGRVSMAI